MMITDADDFFSKGCGRCDRHDTPDCSTKPWIEGLTALRQLCLDAGLTETVKWGHPCYMHAGRNIALFGALRTDFRFSFFNAELLKDPEGLLVPNGPNSPTPSVVKLTDNRQVQKLAPTLTAYIEELKACAEAGIKPVKTQQTLELPEELIEALDADPELAEGFHALTPGRQKSYVINLNGAKKAETRRARIVKFRDKILAGKGAMDR